MSKWETWYKEEVDRKKRVENDLETEKRQNSRYVEALADTAKRLGVYENYLYEETRAKYVQDYSAVSRGLSRYPHFKQVEEKYIAFNVNQFVEDLAQVKKSTGAAERLTPPTESKPKKKENK